MPEDAERKIAKLFLAMSDEEKGVFAAGLCDHLHGMYFPVSATGKSLDEDFILEALTEWAQTMTG